jgi:putative lipoic acid-binding regulatory protein
MRRIMTPLPDEEEKFLALLREVHRFPMAYDVRVICLAATAEWLPERLVGETRLPLVGAPSRRESAAGKYVSLQLQILVQDAPDVVRAYQAIRVMEGVKSYF